MTVMVEPSVAGPRALNLGWKALLAIRCIAQILKSLLRLRPAFPRIHAAPTLPKPEPQ